MKHSDFHIGIEFFTASGKWRCNDVGTRVIVAVSLEPRAIVRISTDPTGKQVKKIFVSDDLRDLNGSPYDVAEYVFDVYDLNGCSFDLADFV